MENNKIATLLLVLLVGLGIGYFWSGGRTQSPQANQHLMSDGSMMHDTGMSMGSAMDDMTAELSGLSGDAFDKAFL